MLLMTCRYLFHLKDEVGWKNFSGINNKNTGTCRLFCSGSVKPQNHILFALSLTSDMKKESGQRGLQGKWKEIWSWKEEIMSSPTWIIFEILWCFWRIKYNCINLMTIIFSPKIQLFLILTPYHFFWPLMHLSVQKLTSKQ